MLDLHQNGVDLQNIEKPNSQQIRVALNRVQLCPDEILEVEKVQQATVFSDALEEQLDSAKVTLSRSNTQKQSVHGHEDK